MLHRAWNLLCLLSLFLCITLTVIWIASYARWLHLAFNSRYLENSLDCYRGQVRILILDLEKSSPVDDKQLGWDAWLAIALDPLTPLERGRPTFLNQLGFARRIKDLGEVGRITYLFFPIAFPWLLSLPLSIHGLHRWRKLRTHKRRQAHNLCLACGYDLRASPTRCPECGRTVEQARP